MGLNSVNSIYLDNEIFSYKKHSHRDFSCFQLHYLHYTIQTETSPCIHRIEFPILNSALKDLIVYYSIRIINRTQVLFQNHKCHFLNIVNDLKMIFFINISKARRSKPLNGDVKSGYAVNMYDRCGQKPLSFPV